MRSFIRKQLNKLGYDIIKNQSAAQWPPDFEEYHKRIIEKVKPYTMTSPERLFGLIEAVKYIHKSGIEGSIVECGVWKGGSMLSISETLALSNEFSRDLYLYDTFEGMPPPATVDINYENEKAQSLLNKDTNKEENVFWAFSTLDEVKKTMSLSNYPSDRIHYIKGKVEDTIPATIPDEIALLRLDTDWYESTRHELIWLFPKLKKGGVLILDDYGYWKGARKAVDEYVAENKIQILLDRLDDTGRIAIKQ
jgi:O-methyltransferase